MKELSIEQKAKAYDEAIDKIADAVEAGTIEQGFAEWLFPELKESEDERIREAIIDTLNRVDQRIIETNYGIKHKDAVAWLEKQKSSDEAYWKMYERTKDRFYKEGLKDGKLCKRKQEEQKSGWSLQDEKQLENIFISIRLNNALSNDKQDELICWLQQYRPYMRKENKSIEWSEEDKSLNDNICTALKGYALHERRVDLYKHAQRLEEMAKKLETLRPQPKQEWNEEGEKIRNWITEVIETSLAIYHTPEYVDNAKGAIAWLEKQGKDKPVDTGNNVEPKFHEGEWITNGDYTWKIVEVKPLDYILQSQDGNIVDDTIFYVDEQFHLWTIEDAKDGDVLMDGDNVIRIFNGIEGMCFRSKFYYSYFTKEFYGIECVGSHKFAKPATKEQRDLLFQKMKEAGYEWDAEKKELNKIEDKPLVIDEGKAEMDRCFTEMMSEYYTKQKPDIEMKTPEESLGVDSDTYNKIVDECVYGEQNTADKTEPKFKVGDIIKPKDGGHEPWQIMQVDILDEKYRFKDGYVIHFSQEDNYELVKQNHVDKVETKFKVGDWVVSPNGVYWHVDSIRDGRYQVSSNSGESADWPLDTNIYHRFTIEDAKDGDVLVNGSNIFIFHFINDIRLMGYCHVNTDDGRFYDDIGKIECFCLMDAVVNPATEEQRDTLERAMADAGCTFDFEKKELKKIEHNVQPTEFEDAIKDMMNDYRDAIDKNDATIEEIKEHAAYLLSLIHQKPAWSEEDEKMLEVILHTLGKIVTYKNFDGAIMSSCENAANWLKSLKDRVQPQPKQDWSEEDEKYWSIVIAEFSKCAGKSVSKDEWTRCNDWLNSLRDRVQPKHDWSEEDEKMLDEVINNLHNYIYFYIDCDKHITWLKSLKERMKGE